jgi:hypothetical protein
MSEQQPGGDARTEVRDQGPEAHGPPSGTATAGPGPSDRPGRDREPARTGAAIGWGIAFITAGVLWVLALLDVPIAWELVLPAGIIVIGVALLAGVRGPVRSGLIGLGVVLAVVAVVAMAIPSLAFTAGERQVTPGSVAELERTYEPGAGVLQLDLRDLDLPAGTTTVAARVNFGELVVTVPSDVAVTGEASVRVGEVDTFTRTAAGFAPSVALDEPGDGTGESGDAAERTLELDLEVGFGRVEVRR